ncbi:MAG: lysylphosphatidylglycerol synthase transmembrane domain-containing protein, partial [Anaerolineae bacterium]
MKDKLLNVLKVAISLGLVVFIFTRPEIRNVDWATVLAELRFWPWLLGLAIYFIAIGFNVLKWQYLLRTLDLHVPFPSLYRYNLVGLFFALLPLSMVGGDIARGWDLARHTEGQAAEVAVSVLVDRLVGLAGFLLASVLGLAAAVLVLGRPELGWL